jgi:hypothetical protein
LSGSWQIAIHGSDTLYLPDSGSEVALADMSVTDPMTDANWLLVDIYGSSPIIKMDDPDERVGGIMVKKKRQLQTFAIHVMPVLFPSEMYKLSEIFDELAYRYFYLFKGTYDFPANNFSIHSDGHCLLLAAAGLVEDDYDNGKKGMTINAFTMYPRA